MSPSEILVIAYSILLIIGGVIGHRAAGSLASIITSVLFGAFLLLSLFIERQLPGIGLRMTNAALAVLILFFGYRWITTGKFMPGGLLCIMTIGVTAALAYLHRS